MNKRGNIRKTDKMRFLLNSTPRQLIDRYNCNSLSLKAFELTKQLLRTAKR